MNKIETHADNGFMPAIEPSGVLRQLVGIGTSLREIFTDERINACQESIDKARAVFFDVAAGGVEKMEAVLASSFGAGMEAVQFKGIADLAGDLKGHAELFDFALFASICGSIIKYCAPGDKSVETRLRLIADLIKMMRVAIKQKIADQNGVIAQELMGSLQAFG